MHLSKLTAMALLAGAATSLPLDRRQGGLSSLLGGGGSSGSSSGASGACNPYTLLYARGTTERGTLGSLGQSLGDGLNSALGGVTIIGTEYPASIAGNAQLGRAGGPRMAQDGQAALQRCPDTKLIIGGYSQGAMVATSAVTASGLPTDKIVAALLFGNPFHTRNQGQIRGVETLSLCNSGDGVCLTGGFAITPAHLTYPRDGSVQKAVTFATQAAQKAGGSGAGTGAATGGSTGGAADEISSSEGSGSSGAGGLGSLLGGGGSSGGLASLLGGGSGGSSGGLSSLLSGASSGGGGLSSLLGGLGGSSGGGGGLSSLLSGASSGGGGLSSLLGGLGGSSGGGGGISSLLGGLGGGSGGGLSSLLGGLGRRKKQ